MFLISCTFINLISLALYLWFVKNMDFLCKINVKDMDFL